MKEEFDTLQEALLEHKLPLTIKMGNLTNINRETLTLQHRRKVLQLEYLKSNGQTSYQPILDETTALLLMIDHSESYRTIEELRASKKKNKIQWFVSSREFCITNRQFQTGHIFTFAPSSLLRSFRRGKKRGIYVLSYPTMEKHFISMDIEAYFYKCGCPSTWKNYKASELMRMRNFPFLLTFQMNSAQIRDGIKRSNTYFVLNIREIDLFYATKKISGSLYLHTFAGHAPSVIKVQMNAKLIDALNNNELNRIVKSIELPVGTDLRYFVNTRPYKEIGISRLVDGISFLDNVDGNHLHHQQLSRINSERRTTRNKLTDNIRKQLSFKVRSPINCRKSFDCNRREIYEDHEPYVNHRAIRSNSEPVDFDDSGYVIVPANLQGTNSTEIHNNSEHNSNYRTNENPAYNYQLNFGQDEEIYGQGLPKDHFYTYVSSPANCTENKENIEGVGITNLQDNVIYKSVNSLDGQLDDQDLVYSYSHISQCNLSKLQRKLRIRELNVNEISDLLKIVKMRHHIAKFRSKEINGDKLSYYCEKDLLELSLTRFESLKLICFVDGWVPLKKTISGEGWLGNMVCDWTVNDVSKYLQHVRMRQLQTFCTRQEVDGFLLIQLIKSNVIDSLKEQHNVTLKEKDLKILKDYVKKDEQPRFEFVERL